LGLFNPVLRSMVEMTYQFEQPFVLDTSKYQAVFGDAGTPLREAIAGTVAWFQRRAGGPSELASGGIRSELHSSDSERRRP
jgi:hypothetical protein